MWLSLRELSQTCCFYCQCWHYSIVSFVLLVQTNLFVSRFQRLVYLKYIPFSHRPVVFLTFLSGRHCHPRTLFVRPKQWFPSARPWDSMPNFWTSIQKESLLTMQCIPHSQLNHSALLCKSQMTLSRGFIISHICVMDSCVDGETIGNLYCLKHILWISTRLMESLTRSFTGWVQVFLCSCFWN